MTRDTYRATISREDPWWVATVEGVGATEAKKIAELEDMVRDLIVVMRDLDKPDFDLTWDYDLPSEAAEALKDYLRSRREHEVAERRYLENAERAAKALDEAKVSTREAAQLMRLSHQRVQQLRRRRGAGSR
ncbi:MAG TPA: hypothetical protein VMV17_18780 [Streptosporangiaceae bacterium]|nr:hypothetical protein [Streptosporangiaceae bacterium]